MNELSELPAAPSYQTIGKIQIPVYRNGKANCDAYKHVKQQKGDLNMIELLKRDLRRFIQPPREVDAEMRQLEKVKTQRSRVRRFAVGGKPIYEHNIKYKTLATILHVNCVETSRVKHNGLRYDKIKVKKTFEMETRFILDLAQVLEGIVNAYDLGQGHQPYSHPTDNRVINLANDDEDENTNQNDNQFTIDMKVDVRDDDGNGDGDDDDESLLSSNIESSSDSFDSSDIDGGTRGRMDKEVVSDDDNKTKTNKRRTKGSRKKQGREGKQSNSNERRIEHIGDMVRIVARKRVKAKSSATVDSNANTKLNGPISNNGNVNKHKYSDKSEQSEKSEQQRKNRSKDKQNKNKQNKNKQNKNKTRNPSTRMKATTKNQEDIEMGQKNNNMGGRKTNKAGINTSQSYSRATMQTGNVSAVQSANEKRNVSARSFSNTNRNRKGNKPSRFNCNKDVSSSFGISSSNRNQSISSVQRASGVVSRSALSSVNLFSNHGPSAAVNIKRDNRNHHVSKSSSGALSLGGGIGIGIGIGSGVGSGSGGGSRSRGDSERNDDNGEDTVVVAETEISEEEMKEIFQTVHDLKNFCQATYSRLVTLENKLNTMFSQRAPGSN